MEQCSRKGAPEPKADETDLQAAAAACAVKQDNSRGNFAYASGIAETGEYGF